MKTVFINCSPKKHFCASAYFIFLQRLFVGGKKVTEKLRTPADHDRILVQLDDAQNVVFSLPLYVDGVPSHVLRFMEKMETYCKEKDLKLSVYCLANNGFIEGRQNEPLMQIFENLCNRAGLNWGGGIGVGGGVMLNVYRIVYVVQFCFTNNQHRSRQNLLYFSESTFFSVFTERDNVLKGKTSRKTRYIFRNQPFFTLSPKNIT